TRVVGRLPDVTRDGRTVFGATYLTQLINFLAEFHSAPPDPTPSTYFGLCAKSFREPVEKVLKDVFGDAEALKTVPPDKPPWSHPILKQKNHFINCHGGDNDPDWYGDRGIVALDRSDVSNITHGTMVTAACCYSAQLYAPFLPENLSMCNTYLASGAVL